MDDSLSIVLFSGTDDKLQAAAVLAAGAAAMGRPVNVFVQYWALDAFRADRIRKDHGAAPEAGVEGADAMRRHNEKAQHWATTLAQAKEIGEVRIHACALSMDLLAVTAADLDPLIDGVEGVAAFMGAATGAMIFI